jgi:hypothetical protein
MQAAAGVEAPMKSSRTREAIADCKVCCQEFYRILMEIDKFLMASSFSMGYLRLVS